MQLTELDDDPAAPFPALEKALREPDGLLAWGGDLSVTRLLGAYRHGCFPWFSEGQPLLWWAPDPRMVLDTDAFHVSRSLRRFLRRSDWTLRADSRFDEVIAQCANTPRRDQNGTWILPAMIAAYRQLQAEGHAHSIEVLDRDDRLVGGIYGVCVGRMFFGESMFSLADNASKVALLGLCRFLQRNDMPMLDCQMHTAHLERLGARPVPRERFIRDSRALCGRVGPVGSWQDAFGCVAARELPTVEPR